MLLDGKKLLITGVLTDDSIAFSVAKVAQLLPPSPDQYPVPVLDELMTLAVAM